MGATSLSDEVEWVRSPSAVMINFAQRVDLLNQLPESGRQGRNVHLSALDRVSDSGLSFEMANAAVENGTVKVKTENGRKGMVLTYRNGKLHGEQKVFSGHSRPLRIFSCEDGKMHGRDRFYDLKGNVTRTILWEHGVNKGLQQFSGGIE